ncbi:MAG: hypothetical protein ACLPN5_23265 [Roseiarcus sp.]
MSALFFTSDTHFGHTFALTKRKRPFPSLGAMDEHMIARWNATVGPDDEVHHLGDLAHKQHPNIAGVLSRLEGRIHLILGNNDDRATLAATGRFATIAEMREIIVDGRNVFLCHYPLREWPNDWRGSWHLFGHVHGKHDDDPNGLSLDVGVDSHGFRPISFAEVAERMAMLAQAQAAQ